MKSFCIYLHDEKSPVEFEKKILWLKGRYNLISYNDVYDIVYNGKVLNNSCHITIDDGWKSTYDIVLPIMKRYNIPFSVFISPLITTSELNFWYYNLKQCPNTHIYEEIIKREYFTKEISQFPIELVLKEIGIDKEVDIIDIVMKRNGINPYRGFMNKEEVEVLSKSSLVEIGAHTMLHPILSLENESRSKKEIINSIDLLEDIIQNRVRSFAYPNGLYNIDFSEREENILKGTSVKIAYSVNPGYVTKDTNPYCIPRIGSLKRLYLGYMGVLLPSLSSQARIRKKIKELKIK